MTNLIFKNNIIQTFKTFMNQKLSKFIRKILSNEHQHKINIKISKTYTKLKASKISKWYKLHHNNNIIRVQVGTELFILTAENYTVKSVLRKLEL